MFALAATWSRYVRWSRSSLKRKLIGNGSRKSIFASALHGYHKHRILKFLWYFSESCAYCKQNINVQRHVRFEVCMRTMYMYVTAACLHNLTIPCCVHSVSVLQLSCHQSYLCKYIYICAYWGLILFPSRSWWWTQKSRGWEKFFESLGILHWHQCFVLKLWML